MHTGMDIFRHTSFTFLTASSLKLMLKIRRKSVLGQLGQWLTVFRRRRPRQPGNSCHVYSSLLSYVGNMSSLQQGLIHSKPSHYAASARGSRRADLWHYLEVKRKGSTWRSGVHNCWLSHNTAGKRSLWSRYC